MYNRVVNYTFLIVGNLVLESIARGKQLERERDLPNIYFKNLSLSGVLIKAQIMFTILIANILIAAYADIIGLVSVFFSIAILALFYLPRILRLLIAHGYFLQAYSLRSMTYLLFYTLCSLALSMVFVALLLVFPQVMIWFLPFFYLYSVPQIIMDVFNKHINSWDSFEIFQAIALFLPLTYYMGCPAHFSQIPGEPAILWIVALTISLTYFLRYLQSKNFQRNVPSSNISIQSHEEYQALRCYQVIGEKDKEELTNIVKKHQNKFGVEQQVKIECPICLQELIEYSGQIVVQSQTSTLARTRCEHLFHITCINEWLNTRNSCPSCRQCLF